MAGPGGVDMPLPGKRPTGPLIAWGALLSPDEKQAVLEVAQALKFDPSVLTTIMRLESGLKTGPRSGIRAYNPKGKAVGLIQFIPRTARSLGTTPEALYRMSFREQMYYVYKYFSAYKHLLGDYPDIGEVYIVCFWPKAARKPMDYILFTAADNPRVYGANRATDRNADGLVTKREALSKAGAWYYKGLGRKYVG